MAKAVKFGSVAAPGAAGNDVVDALVRMLSGAGIDRSHIDAMIDKASRSSNPSARPLAANGEVPSGECKGRRIA